MNKTKENIALLTVVAAVFVTMGAVLLTVVAFSLSNRFGVSALAIDCLGLGRYAWALAREEAAQYSSDDC